MLQSLGMILAVLPVAPFTAPPSISVPSNIPSIPPGVYTKASWLDTANKNSSTFRSDTYIRTPRRRGNIVSIFVIERRIQKETQKFNRHIKGYGDGLFLPGYSSRIYRYDCQNDKYSVSTPLLLGSAWGGVNGFLYPTGPNENDWQVIPGQTKVIIEGRPYWAMRPQSDPRHIEKKVEWKYIVPESYGASQIDYACTNF